jgi:hypothetical protein
MRILLKINSAENPEEADLLREKSEEAYYGINGSGAATRKIAIWARVTGSLGQK